MKDFLKRISPFILILAFLLATGQAVLAQAGVNVKLDNVDVSAFPKLTAYATVIDENGLPIPGLTADRFELVEDGRTSFPPSEVQAITSDKAAVSVLILIDLSGSMNGKPLQAAKEATTRFLEKLLNAVGDPDQAAFIGFGRQVDIKALAFTDETREVPFTNDMGRLLNVVNFLEVERNTGTPLYDAVYRGVKITAQQSGRRAIIVMTDGRDVGSTLKDGDPIAEAQRQHIPIFTIGLSNSRLDQTYLKRLSELTGGQYQEATTPDQLGQKFGEVLSRIKVQYLLTYQSRLPELDGQYHSLLLRVNTPRGQGFDEIKFQLGQPSVAAATPSEPKTAPQLAATSQPVETSGPQPAGISTGDKGMFDLLSQNILLVGIVLAAFLLLVLMIVFVVVLMRRRAAPPEPAWESESYGVAEPGWSAGAPSPGLSSYSSPASPGAVPGGSMPTGGVGTPPGLPGTQKAPSPFDPSSAPTPFGMPPRPLTPDTPASGGTVIIQRGQKPKVMGLLVDRKQPGRRYDVDKPVVTIGRTAGNNIVLDHPTVSRQHATIKLEGNDFRLYDLGSANGSFVADKRVREPVTLEDGVVVRFGEEEFTFKRLSLE